MELARRARWDALAAGAALESALAEINPWLGRIEPEGAERLLGEFQMEFEKAFRRQDAAVCRRTCERYVARFRAFSGGAEMRMRKTIDQRLHYINPIELSQRNASGLEPHEIPEAARLMETGLKTVLDFAIAAAAKAPIVEEDRWLTPTQVTEKYGLSRRWIFEHRSEPFVKDLGRKTLLISEQKLVRWLNGNKVRAAR